MSTRNPRAKWGRWVIGGRRAGYFPYKKDHDGEVIPAEPHWSSDNKPIPAGRCDGGPLRALDLARLRKEKADGARKTWAEYQAVIEGTRTNRRRKRNGQAEAKAEADRLARAAESRRE